MEMKFNQLHEGISCNCLSEDVSEDTTSVFMRTLKRGHSELKAFDVLSHHQRRIPMHSKNPSCKEVCRHRGLSIDKLQSGNESKIIANYVRAFNIKPKISRSFCKFRLKEGAGLVEHTPSHNDFHHTLYKSDGLTLDHIEVLNVAPINVSH